MKSSRRELLKLACGVLMFSDRSVQGNVDILKKLAVDVYAGAGKEALSKTVFLWNYGRWEALG